MHVYWPFTEAVIQHSPAMTFTSHFLCPPDTVTATPIECSVDLTWKKPDCGGCTLKTYIYDDGIAGDGYTTTIGLHG